MKLPNWIPTSLLSALSKSVALYGRAQGGRLAAAFSFFFVLSLAPLLVSAIAVASVYFGSAKAAATIVSQAKSAFGSQSADLFAGILKTAHQGATLATITSVLLAFFGASGLFDNLRSSADTLMEREPEGGSWKSLVVSKIISVVALLAVIILIVGWLGLDAWLAYESRALGLSGGFQVISFLATVIFLTGLFFVSFQALSYRHMKPRAAFIGAMVAGGGCSLAKLLLSVYFAYSGVSTAYGSAGALVVILLWTFYTSQIFFFGFALAWSLGPNSPPYVAKH